MIYMYPHLSVSHRCHSHWHFSASVVLAHVWIPVFWILHPKNMMTPRGTTLHCTVLPAKHDLGLGSDMGLESSTRSSDYHCHVDPWSGHARTYVRTYMYTVQVAGTRQVERVACSSRFSSDLHKIQRYYCSKDFFFLFCQKVKLNKMTYQITHPLQLRPFVRSHQPRSSTRVSPATLSTRTASSASLSKALWLKKSASAPKWHCCSHPQETIWGRCRQP